MMLGLLVTAAASPAADLEQWRDEVVPLVERAAGRSFVSVPPIRSVAATAMAQIVSREQEIAFQARYPEVGPRDRRWLLHLSGIEASHALVGKYHLDEKAIWIAPAAVRSWIAAHDLDVEQYYASVTQCVIAHELVHALQDEVVDLSVLWQSRPHADAFTALQAVVEGQASLVHREVCAELGYAEAGALMDTVTEVRTESFKRVARREAYGAGLQFATHWQGQLFDILADPPLRTEVIWDPERYAPGAVPAPVLNALEASLREMTRRERMTTSAQPIGPVMMTRHFDVFGEAVGRQLQARVEAAYQARGGDDYWRVEIYALDFDRPAAAAGYVKQYRSLAEEGIRTRIRTVQSTVDDWAVSGDVAFFEKLAMLPPDGGAAPPDEWRNYWVARGDHVIALRLSNVNVPKKRLILVVDALFAHVDADAKMRNAPP